jgi:glycerate dehydrogenase
VSALRGVFLDLASVARGEDGGDLDLGALEAALPEWSWYPATRPDQVAERLRGATVAVCNKVVLDRPALEAAPDLGLIAVIATGTNNIDLAAARERGIVVSNIRAYATPSVVQHVFAALLALATRQGDYARAVQAGRWQTAEHFCLLDYPIRELAGMTLGIVGYGELGQAVARVGEALGMRVLVAQRPGRPNPPERLPLHALLGQVDVLSIHTPLTEETRGLIGPAELALMRPDALLINTARGGIVDEAALSQALRSGRLGGAAVDVLTREPPVDGNPLLADDIPSLIVTPHVAWASREARQRAVDQVAANIRAFLAGTPRNRVA